MDNSLSENKAEAALPPQALWLLVGLVGCGKTTFCQKLWGEDPHHTIRVCLDDIIQMLSFYQYERKLSPFYGELERGPIIKGLVRGYRVIIDRTNLTPKGRHRFLNMGQKVRKVARDLLTIGRLTENPEESLEGYRRLCRYLSDQLVSRANAEEDDRYICYQAFYDLVGRRYAPQPELSLFNDTAPPDLMSLGYHLERLGQIELCAAYFEIPLDVCLKRRLEDPLNTLRERTRKIDWCEVIERMQEELEPPTLEEGFDRIITIDDRGEVIAERTSTDKI